MFSFFLLYYRKLVRIKSQDNLFLQTKIHVSGEDYMKVAYIEKSFTKYKVLLCDSIVLLCFFVFFVCFVLALFVFHICSRKGSLSYLLRKYIHYSLEEGEDICSLLPFLIPN